MPACLCSGNGTSRRGLKSLQRSAAEPGELELFRFPAFAPLDRAVSYGAQVKAWGKKG